MTLYEWCLERNVRILDLKSEDEDNYFLKDLDYHGFVNICLNREIKPESTPRKPEKFLELRMYGFVPYNISDIQKGIQFGHAVVEYGMKNMNTLEYQNFTNLWKTFIILNGGTSNDGTPTKHGFSTINYIGSLNTIESSLIENNIKYANFREPDLNNMLTAVVFLVDERVFNQELYPDFKSHPYPWLVKNRNAKPSAKEFADWQEADLKNYEAWVEKIGGKKNVFLRDLLRGKKLA